MAKYFTLPLLGFYKIYNHFPLRSALHASEKYFIRNPNTGDTCNGNASLLYTTSSKAEKETAEQPANQFGAQHKNLASIIRGIKSTVTRYANKKIYRPHGKVVITITLFETITS